MTVVLIISSQAAGHVVSQTLDKNTTKVTCDVAMAEKYHHRIDFCRGATIYAPLRISTLEFPPLGCPVAAHGPTSTHNYATFNKVPPSFASPTTITRCTDQDRQLFSCIKTTFVQDEDDLELYRDELKRFADDDELRREYLEDAASLGVLKQ